MALEQAVEEPLLARAPHLPELERLRAPVGSRDIGVRSTSTGCGRTRTASGFRGRIRTAGSSMCPARCQSQHQASGHHVPQRPVGLPPAPRLAQPLRQPPAALTRGARRSTRG